MFNFYFSSCKALKTSLQKKALNSGNSASMNLSIWRLTIEFLLNCNTLININKILPVLRPIMVIYPKQTIANWIQYINQLLSNSNRNIALLPQNSQQAFWALYCSGSLWKHSKNECGNCCDECCTNSTEKNKLFKDLLSKPSEQQNIAAFGCGSHIHSMFYTK